MNKFYDGLGGEINLWDFPEDDTGNSAFAERNEDDMPREKFLIARIGQSATIIAVDFSGYYLEKHINIIA